MGRYEEIFIELGCICGNRIAKQPMNGLTGQCPESNGYSLGSRRDSTVLEYALVGPSLHVTGNEEVRRVFGWISGFGERQLEGQRPV